MNWIIPDVHNCSLTVHNAVVNMSMCAMCSIIKIKPYPTIAGEMTCTCVYTCHMDFMHTQNLSPGVLCLELQSRSPS